MGIAFGAGGALGGAVAGETIGGAIGGTVGAMAGGRICLLPHLHNIFTQRALLTLPQD